MRMPLFSLRTKIISIVLLITGVALAAGFGFVIFTDVRTYRRNLVNTSVLLARVTGNSCVSDLAFGDRESTAQTLARLASTASIAGAYVYDTKGELFASHAGKELVRLPDDALKRQGTRVFRDEFLYVAEPIDYEGEHYGSIVLATSTAPLYAAIRQHLVTMSVAIALLVLISLVFAFRLEHFISGPILGLAAAARKISERHDYTIRVNKSANDEIGELCDGFNDMLSEIERRQRERDEADRRTREKSHFLANMSHELRTPLNAIIGFSEILLARLETKVTTREKSFLENIHVSGQHLLGLVNDILDLSKVEAGLMEVHPEVFYLEPAIEGVCVLMKGVSTRRSIEVEVDCELDMPPIEADPVKVKQILYNLISNAVKFSNEGGTVTVRARRIAAAESPLEVETVRIEVIDRGIGIDSADHERIFEEFKQIDSPLARKSEGTGLGLALVRKLVQLHKGQIDLKSAIGEGSTFTINIPRRFSQMAEVQQAAPEQPTSQPRPVVLVVEDEAEAYLKLERQLVAAGYMPMHATNGEEALRMAAALVPAAITLDLVLPGIDGWDVLRRLKADATTRRIPVVIVSVMQSRELGLAFGADDYLVKPVPESQVIDVLGRVTQTKHDSRAEVLLVSDDSLLHESLNDSAKDLGFRLRHAYTVAGGIAEATQMVPDLLVVDLMMENLRGIEVATHVKNDPVTSDVAMIVLTSAELSYAERNTLTDNFSSLVQRQTVQEDKLIASVQDLLQRRQQEPSLRR